MELPPELRIIHEPARLRILGLLYRETDVSLTVARTTLGLTGGNLASHVARLEEAGLVETRDALSRDGFEKRMQVTPEGLAAFSAYLEALERFLAESRAPLPPPTAAPKVRPGGPWSKVTLGAVGVGLVFIAGETVQTYLSGASGSDYVGIGLAGGLVGLLASLERFMRRLVGGR